MTYDETDKMPDSGIGGLGGFFNFHGKTGMRWKDYIDQFNDLGVEYVEALRKEIVEKKIKRSGSWHKSETEEGAPVFSDGKAATYSYRAWGNLLAAIWSEEEDKDYSYPNFAYYSDLPEWTS